MTIRPVRPDDAAAIAATYNHYIENTVITFEEAVLEPADMAERIREYSATYPWLVLEDADGVVAWAYATRFRPRSAFRHTVESSVYVRTDKGGRGYGKALYAALLPLLQEQGVHAVIASICLPNAASVALHEGFGFGKVGHLAQVGYKFGQWLDLGYWELVFG